MKSSNAVQKIKPQIVEKKCALKLKAAHEHIHAANCGHKSYVHNGHICFEHDGHYHYTHEDHVHECPGPFSTQPSRPVATNLGTDTNNNKNNVIDFKKAQANRKK